MKSFTTPSPAANAARRHRWVAALALALAALPVATLRAEDRADGKPYTQKIPSSEVSFQMVPIPAGKFMMGSPDSEKKRKADEGPQHEVTVDAFWMEQTETTQAEYDLFRNTYSQLAEKGAPSVPKDKLSDAVTYPTPMYELEAGPIFDRMGRGGKFPAVIVSQYAAKQYCKWLSKKTGRFYRLPTEAEWEYAARAGTTTAYSFGDDAKDLGDHAWYFDNSNLKDGDPGYHEVGQKKPNPWGLYDMHGNVAEWCIDAYDADWYKQFAGKTTAARDTIKWPNQQYPRTIRGGSWNSEKEECRSAARYEVTEKLNIKDPQLPKSPHWMSDGFWVGFRVISPVKEPPEAEKTKYWDADDDYTREILQRDREIREVIPPAAPAK